MVENKVQYIIPKIYFVEHNNEPCIEFRIGLLVISILTKDAQLLSKEELYYFEVIFGCSFEELIKDLSSFDKKNKFKDLLEKLHEETK
jgi:hypothetical protein